MGLYRLVSYVLIGIAAILIILGIFSVLLPWFPLGFVFLLFALIALVVAGYFWNK